MPPKKRKSAKKTPNAKTDILTTALKNKADRSRYTLGDLKKVYERGVAAYLSSGSRNTSVGAWSMGRVSSFVSGDGGARKADIDIHQNRLKNPKKKTKKKK
jgi:hypothetical protein|tara:strand:+ start:1670 stop:1972 length:303 start_codon:yes stop_codon:yes gene_type:complete